MIDFKKSAVFIGALVSFSSTQVLSSTPEASPPQRSPIAGLYCGAEFGSKTSDVHPCTAAEIEDRLPVIVEHVWGVTHAQANLGYNVDATATWVERTAIGGTASGLGILGYGVYLARSRGIAGGLLAGALVTGISVVVGGATWLLFDSKGSSGDLNLASAARDLFATSQTPDQVLAAAIDDPEIVRGIFEVAAEFSALPNKVR